MGSEPISLDPAFSWPGSGRRGIGYSFLTNNPSKSIADYLSKARRFGHSGHP